MKGGESSRKLQIREQERLQERLVCDEARMEEIIDLLMERDITQTSKETDDLIQEFHNLNLRVEQAKEMLGHRLNE